MSAAVSLGVHLPSEPAGPFLRVLGAFQLADAEGAVMLDAGKPLALLAFLACAPRREASRRSLIDLLWGVGEPERGRSSLRQAIFTLRQLIGGAAIDTEKDTLRLNAHLRVDAQDFVAALAKGDTAQAIELYKGEFVPNFAAPGAAAFEEWADIERLRLRNAFVAAARTQARIHMDRGEATEAVALSGRLRDTDPDDDQNWRLRIEALALAGRFALIELEESTLRATRTSDGRALDAATESLLRRLRTGGGDMGAKRDNTRSDAESPSRTLLEPEFQGRTDIFAHLLATWALACRKQTQVRMLVAAAGMGKTRLLSELGHRLRTRRSNVIRVGARQRERDDPFSFLAELVSRLAESSGAAGIGPASAAVLAGLVPTLADRFHVQPEVSGSDAAEVMRRRALAVADLIGAVADEAPIAIFADDLQWADVTSLEALQRAIARVHHESVLMVAASREPATGPFAEYQQLVLPALSVDEVRGLIGSIANAEEPHWSEGLTLRIHDVTAGTPFAVLQFLRLGIEQFVLHFAGDRWHIADEAALRLLLERSAAMGWRIRALMPADLDMLAYLAIAGGPLDERVLADASGFEPDKLKTSLFRLETDAFVARDGAESWRIAHDLVSDAVLGAVESEHGDRLAARLGHALAPAVTDMKTLRNAVRILLDGGEFELALDLARRWLSAQPGNANMEELVTTLVGVNPRHREFESRLRTLTRRNVLRSRAAPVILAAATAVVLLAAAWAALKPRTIVYTGTLSPTDASRPEFIYEEAPQVELRNALGLRSTWRDGDTMHIAPVDSSGTLRGRNVAVIRNGRAVFDSTYPSTQTGQLITDVQFSTGRLPALVLRSLRIYDSLAVSSAVLNGVQLNDTMPVLRVGAGEAIDGFVWLRYSTLKRDLMYTLAQTISWGRPDRDTLTVRSLLAGVQGAKFATRVRLTAPRRAGSYWLLWIAGAESDGKWLLSGTNWKCMTPRWDDGNEIAKFSDSILAPAVRVRFLWMPYLYCDEGQLQAQELLPRRLPIAGVRIDVTAQP